MAVTPLQATRQASEASEISTDIPARLLIGLIAAWYFTSL
jgi:hypothetical protein